MSVKRKASVSVPKGYGIVERPGCVRGVRATGKFRCRLRPTLLGARLMPHFDEPEAGAPQ